MKKILVLFSVFLIGTFGADAATPRPSPRTQSQTTTSARGVRSTTNARTSARPVVTPSSQTTSTGTRNVTTITSAPSARRDSSSAVTSRAAKQSAISTGTKITAAAQNTVVDEACWNGFMGCMDSFCMLDNMNGGRCLCSDKNAEYDSILAEIQSLDEQSYQMATVGVEQIEMGASADAVIAKTQEITKKLEKDAANAKRNALDLTLWDASDDIFDSDAMDIFALSSDETSVTNKTGDALYRAAAKLCNTQIPECASQSKMMEMMYQQRIRSDCTAYENSLRQQRTQSAQKLATAQSAMREAALEQYRNANKYDLGQCTVQFKQCMQTTGGCGDDFTGCVGLIQEATTKSMNSKANSQFNFDKIKQKKIKSNSTSITIAQSTYDILESKKPLCETVTQQCVNVADQVWDTFIREVAPQVKSAELISESNLRTSCISNIANCFQKGCRDRIDPNDPDGSYDMCLTRPQTLEDTCKVEIAPCKAAIPNIMDYVTARLKSMRVDSCTREFKACLTSEDRCGEDYTQCIGLDTATIVDMCPDDKLPGCYYQYGNNETTVQDTLEEIATGIFLNIDNNMLTACQRAADEAMIRVCGSTENCDELVVDNGAGTRSLKYEVCKYTIKNDNTLDEQYCRDSVDGFTKEEIKDNTKPLIGKLSGLIYWGDISYQEESDGSFQFTPIDTYMDKVAKEMKLRSAADLSDDQKEIIRDRVYGMEIKTLTSAVENAIKTIESDQVVQYCITGRKFQGMNENTFLGTFQTIPQGGGALVPNPKLARFPHLTRQMRSIIANSALKNARDNYIKKYDEEMERMAQDQVKAAQLIDDEAAKAKAAEMCIALGNSGTLPTTEGPKASNAGKWVVAGLLITAGVALAVFTGGTSLGISVAGTAILETTMSVGVAAGIAVGAAGAAVGISAANNPTVGEIGTIDECKLPEDAQIGCSVAGSWNYKEKIVTVPIYETGKCLKVKVTQNCTKTKKDYCDEWGVEEEHQETIDLLN